MSIPDWGALVVLIVGSAIILFSIKGLMDCAKGRRQGHDAQWLQWIATQERYFKESVALGTIVVVFSTAFLLT